MFHFITIPTLLAKTQSVPCVIIGLDPIIYFKQLAIDSRVKHGNDNIHHGNDNIHHGNDSIHHGNDSIHFITVPIFFSHTLV